MSRSHFYGTATLLVAALLLGGGGAVSPLHNLIIQLLAVALLAIIAWRGGPLWAGGKEAATVLLLLLIVMTPLLQLVPLPYAMWSALPGRELAVEIDSLLREGGWRPLSLDAESTLLGAAYLLAPAAMFLAVLRLDEEERHRLVRLGVGVALFSLALAAAQFAAGDGELRLYDGSHSAFASGLFINRNHQADLLLIAMILASYLIWRQPKLSPLTRWSLWGAAMLGIAAGIIATSSRMGFLLLPLALLASATFIPRTAIRKHGASLLWGGAALLVAIAFVATSATTSRVLARFDSASEGRFQFWSDTLVLARQYFPWGSGVGTFDPVYRAIEDLNRMDAPYINHAHNDYVEIIIETGVWGLALVIAYILLFGWLALRKKGATQLRRAAAFSILILLLHSAVDYPLRMLGLLTLFAMLSALLLPVRSAPGRIDRPEAKGV